MRIRSAAHLSNVAVDTAGSIIRTVGPVLHSHFRELILSAPGSAEERRRPPRPLFGISKPSVTGKPIHKLLKWTMQGLTRDRQGERY